MSLKVFQLLMQRPTYYCYYYYYLLTANGFVPGGSGTKNTKYHISLKITHNTQNNTQHKKLQIQ
jgi:hypothetical protein